jgi:hypothetical protein
MPSVLACISVVAPVGCDKLWKLRIPETPRTLTITMSASLAPECNEVKEYALLIWIFSAPRLTLFRRYDSCFLKWYSESMLFAPS